MATDSTPLERYRVVFTYHRGYLGPGTGSLPYGSISQFIQMAHTFSVTSVAGVQTAQRPINSSLAANPGYLLFQYAFQNPVPGPYAIPIRVFANVNYYPPRGPTNYLTVNLAGFLFDNNFTAGEVRQAYFANPAGQPFPIPAGTCGPATWLNVNYQINWQPPAYASQVAIGDTIAVDFQNFLPAI